MSVLERKGKILTVRDVSVIEMDGKPCISTEALEAFIGQHGVFTFIPYLPQETLREG